MRFGVLGPLEVWTTEGRPVRVPEVKVRALLAVLLAHQGRVVTTDQLIDSLWGGSTPPANPTASLQAKVSQLRRALEEAEPGSRELVVHRAPGYVLKIEDDSADVGRFRTLLARARTIDDTHLRADALAQALTLWRGPAFADFADQPSVRGIVAELEEERLTAVEEHAETRLALGEHSILVGELTSLVTVHPLRERLRVAQMRALYRTGRSSEALDSYADLRRRLDEELGLVPGPAIDALQQAILRQDPALRVIPAAAPAGPDRRCRSRSNLPDPVTPLVGREGAVQDGRRLIEEHRLITFTGPGGVGKTRLATAAASELTGHFPDGVWLVELAGIDGPQAPTNPDSVARQVMAALGIREDFEGQDRPTDGSYDSGRHLTKVLGSRELLLVLDNCEHVVDAVAELATLIMESTARITILTTSQEPLRVVGETVWPVPPLELPPSDHLPDLERSSAARLFVQRASAADPGFTLDAETAPVVAAVCRRLDGIPLALELAATRVRALGIRELLERLDNRFNVLNNGYRGAPPRQQTLQATIDWSWNLLTAPEQAVLRRLTVYAESCTLAAAEAVCTGGDVAADDVVDILARLVDRSLVTRLESGGQTRYRLLESVAAYAQRELTAAGEAAELAARHARYYTALTEHARSRLHNSDQHRWLRTLNAESANFRRALEHAHSTGAAHVGLRMVNSLSWYWFLVGRLGEAWRGLSVALDTAGEAPAAAVTEAETWAGGFRLLLGLDEAPGRDEAPPGNPAPTTTAGPSDPHEHTVATDGPARGTHEPVHDAVRDGSPDDGAPREQFTRRSAPDRTLGCARAEWFLGFALWDTGALSACEARVNRALADFRALRDAWGVAAALSSRAALAMARGDLATLRDNALEARAQFLELGDVWGQLKTAEALGVHAEVNAEYELAAQLHREGLRMAQSLEMWSEESRQLSGLGRIALLTERYDEAREFHQRALQLAIEQGNLPAQQMAELGLALGARREGDLEAAAAHLQPWLEWNRERNASNGLALVLAELGFAAELRGDAEAALTLHRSGLEAALATEDPRAVALALEGLAGAHSLTGRHIRSARLLGTSAATRVRSGAPLPPAERGDVDRIAARVRSALGDAKYTAEHAAGEAMDHHSAAVAEQLTEAPANNRRHGIAAA